jgi:FAD/FMN-containing dehydrogenase
MVNVTAFHERPDETEEHEAWSSSLAAALSADATRAYAGFMTDDGEQGVRRAYPAATRARLAEVKRRYDPDNLFRLNLNVPPAA